MKHGRLGKLKKAKRAYVRNTGVNVQGREAATRSHRLCIDQQV